LCTRSKAERDGPKAVLLGSGYAPPGGVCSGASAHLAGSAQIEQEDTLIPGTFYEFSGPLHDQGGRLRVRAGEKLSVRDLYASTWLVKGVIGGSEG
jgi:hypothetical protein